MKNLIYAILMTQSCLVNIIADELESIRRKRLSYASDFYALSLILKRPGTGRKIPAYFDSYL